jgi:hypothetical protein
VTADPLPNDAIFLHNCQSTVLEPDAGRLNIFLAFQFLELQAWVCRIALEKTIGTLCVPLDVEWQIGE